MVDTGFPESESVVEDFSFTSGQCQGDAGTINLNGQRVESYKTSGFVQGENVSALPTDEELEAPIPGQPIVTYRDDSDCSGQTSWTSPTPGGVDGDWNTVTDINTLANCFGASTCGEGEPNSCSGTYAVTIYPDASLDRICDDYDPVRVELGTVDMGARRARNANAGCSAGTGTFQLIPMRARDKDDDDSYRVTLLPVMIAGTGVMTNAAWVTQIDIVEDQGNALKVVQPDEPIVWDPDDTLGSTVGTFTLDAENPFDVEEVSGHPVFVVEEVDLDNVGQMQVEMAWSCGTAPTVSQAQGYVISLNALDCSLPEKLVMRTYGNPLWVSFEQYGNPNYSLAVPTTPAGGDDLAFTVHVGLLEVEGTLLSHDSQDAEVALTTITWDGVGICDEGTYVFNAE